MAYRRFLPASLVGTGLWGAGFTTLGYAFSRSFADVSDALATLGTTLTVLVAARRRRVRPAARRVPARQAP